MFNRIIKFIGFLFFLVLLISAYLYFTSGLDVKIPKSLIQKEITNYFPIDNNTSVVNITFDNPQLYFKETNIGLKLNYNAKFTNNNNNLLNQIQIPENIFLKEQIIKGQVDFNSELKYNNKSGEFYLQNFKIENISFSDVQFSLNNNIQDIVKNILDEQLANRPIYRLNNENMVQKILRKNLKNTRIEGENLVLTFSYFN